MLLDLLDKEMMGLVRLNARAGIEQMPALAKSSMLQDVEANRQLEVDLFAGTICKLGRKYGVATPYNDVVFELLTAINERIV